MRSSVASRVYECYEDLYKAFKRLSSIIHFRACRALASRGGKKLLSTVKRGKKLASKT